MKTALLLALFAFTLAAQLGGPLPGQYPPGQYPPGRYPGGRTPGSQPGSQPGQRGSGRNAQQKQPVNQPQTVSGLIRKVESKSFELELADTRFLVIQILDTTTPQPADLRVGDGVDVVVTESKDGPFQASSIKPNNEIVATIEENDRIASAPQEGRTAPPPTIMSRSNAPNDPDDAGPPKLKRGKPPERASSVPSQDGNGTEVAERPAVRPVSATTSRQAFIEQARLVASTFLEGLPDYICQESATRYVSETREPNWNVIDVVSAEVVFEGGKESYRNVQINGKPSKKAPEESGAWSTGEFGSILAEIYAPYSAAEFKHMQDETMAHQPASVYDFRVDRRRSAWRVWVPGQYIVPAFKGSVWIDKQSAHTLRIEMQAREIPEAFPEINVETAVDYDYVTLGTPEKFLLPVHAEILSCLRGSNQCQRNAIEFRNYHKFTGESTIKFNQ
jgi:hypothetical protein